MPDVRLHTALAALLLCLFAPYGCEKPPDAVGDAQPASAVAAPAANSAPSEKPPAAVADTAVEPAAADGKRLTLESLVLKPDDDPSTEDAAHGFGEVPDADWLAAPPSRPAPGRVLPDMFDSATDHDRLNLEGELMLDGSQGTSRLVDGVGVKIHINTDD
jgi:hypothetical protein